MLAQRIHRSNRDDVFDRWRPETLIPALARWSTALASTTNLVIERLRVGADPSQCRLTIGASPAGDVPAGSAVFKRAAMRAGAQMSGFLEWRKAPAGCKRLVGRCPLPWCQRWNQALHGGGKPLATDLLIDPLAQAGDGWEGRTAGVLQAHERKGCLFQRNIR